VSDEHLHSAARVIDLHHAREVRDGTERWLTKQQIAHILGFSARWIEYRVAEDMPCRRMGGRLRFQRSVVERWLADREENKAS
jgi:predicted DNA-binding transcriptional regulator AlpA